jgi:hypothetical protein
MDLECDARQPNLETRWELSLRNKSNTNVHPSPFARHSNSYVLAIKRWHWTWQSRLGLSSITISSRNKLNTIRCPCAHVYSQLRTFWQDIVGMSNNTWIRHGFRLLYAPIEVGLSRGLPLRYKPNVIGHQSVTPMLPSVTFTRTR